MENIIQTSHLTKRYGSKIAVNDLNLSIHKGEVFGLLRTERCRKDDNDPDAARADRANGRHSGDCRL